MDYKITYNTSVCVPVCRHSYGCKFEPILMKLCTVVLGPKVKFDSLGIKIRSHLPLFLSM